MAECVVMSQAMTNGAWEFIRCQLAMRLEACRQQNCLAMAEAIDADVVL